MRVRITNAESLRQAVREFCAFLEAHNVPSESIFDSRLVANELLGNVLRHGNGIAELIGELKEGFVELTVLSNAPFFPSETPCAEVHSEHGRGLFLVRSVCKGCVTVEEDGLKVRIQIMKN